MIKGQTYRLWNNKGGWRVVTLISSGYKWIKFREVGSHRNYKIKANQTNLIKEIS